MNINDYFIRLSGHDWFFDYSEYHPTWKAGFEEQKELLKLAALSPQHKEIYDQWKEHKFNHGPLPILIVEVKGEAVGTGK